MIYFFVLLISYMSGIGQHAFHVSICQIDFDEKNRQLEITHKLFLDDLELTLIAWSGEKVDVLNPASTESLNSMIADYISETFEVTTNGKLSECKFIGAEKDGDVMYCYVVITDVKKLKSIAVKNTIMMEMYDDQTNLIHVDVGEETRSLKLNLDTKKGELIYSD